MAVRDFQYELQCFASKLWNLRCAGKSAYLTVESQGPQLSLCLKLDLSVQNHCKPRSRPSPSRLRRRAEAAAGKAVSPVHPRVGVDATVQVAHPVHPRVGVDVAVQVTHPVHPRP